MDIITETMRTEKSIPYGKKMHQEASTSHDIALLAYQP